MSSFSLPNECINDVFSLLDSNSLYKCLFVNRYYCKLSIPVIWRDPFITPIPNGFSLIKTLLACLNEDEISSLIPYTINLNNQPPLFEYGKFIRNFHHENFVAHVVNWLNSSSPEDYEDYRIQKLVNAIYHAIMRQGSNLQKLVLSYRYIGCTIDLPKISILTTYKPGITNLKSLKIMDTYDNNKCQNVIELLNMVPKFCNDIVDIVYFASIFNDGFIKPFLNIIMSQPLESILIYGDGDGINSIGNENVKKIMHTLEFRSETLRVLLFEDIDLQGIDLSFIFKLERLERLNFDRCKGFFMPKYYKALSKKKLHLKELSLWHDTFYFYDDNGSFNGFGTSSDVIKTIMSAFCSEALLKLSLDIATLETIKAIKEFCPNIISLEIAICLKQYLDSIIPLICELSLKILKINIDEDVVDIFVTILCDHLISVESLLFNFHIELPSFEYFTNNCKANLKELTIIFDDVDNHQRKHYLTCVNNYQKIHKSLKVLEIKCDQFYEYDKSDWTDEELEIIDLLEDQGVQLFVF